MLLVDWLLISTQMHFGEALLMSTTTYVLRRNKKNTDACIFWGKKCTISKTLSHVMENIVIKYVNSKAAP